MAYVKRTIEIHYESNDLEFESGEKVRAFYAALGRMMFYGMDGAEEDTVAKGCINTQKMNGGTDKTPCEVVLTYKHASHPDQIGFTMGAVLHSHDNAWSFHS